MTEPKPNIAHAEEYCRMGLHTCTEDQRALITNLVKVMLERPAPVVYDSSARMYADMAANLAHIASLSLQEHNTIGAKDRLRSNAYFTAIAIALITEMMP